MAEQHSGEFRDGSGDGMKKALSYRWIVWGVMVFAFMVVFFHRFAAAVVKDDVTRDFSLSATSFGAMASMYFYAYMIMQIPVGFLADSLGARITVSLGMFLAGAGSVIFGFAPSLSWLFLGRFLVGIGVSTVFVSIMKIQSQWFRDREFATISGATTLVGNAGGIFSQGPLALLISVVSWRAGFVAIGLLTLAIAALCFRFIRNRPQDMGLPPVNEREIARANLPPDPFSVVSGLKNVLSVRGIFPTTLFYLFNQAGFFALISTWGIPWLVNAYGLSVQEASSYSVTLIFGIMAGGAITGWISDRLGRRKAPMLVSSVLHMVLWAVILLSKNGTPPLGWLKPVFFLLGITNTAFVLAWSVAKELTSEKYTGLAISILNAAGFLSIALCTSVMGWVIDLFAHLTPAGAYRMAFMLPLVSAVLSFLSVLFIPETGSVKNEGTLKKTS
ncbi:MFS transporter [Aminivibrio sp.]|uniref:MFS transporter n=1 Tax=Aminivibrio sp. TaxID=1872489 RepID=UPI001A464260|nr:MFS transporter [Aminivibrio sp.]MBL3539647.1 MFS transporter [Aminivibrio sp.]